MPEVMHSPAIALRIRLRAITIFRLIGLAANLLWPLTAAAQQPVKIATFNCEFLVRDKVHMKYGLELDPRDWKPEQRAEWEQPGFRDARFAESVAAVAQVVKRLDADVLGLVEVGPPADVEPLRQAVQALGLDYPHVAVCESTDVFTGQHVALLSKVPLQQVTPQIPGRESYDGELDEPDVEFDTGISKGLSATVTVAGQNVYLYLVHLTSERGGHDKDAQRIAQASIVRRSYLASLTRGNHVIVLGDLNAHRGQPAIRRIRGRDDMWDDLLEAAGPSFYARRTDEPFPAYNARVGDHWSYEFNGLRQQLDHILISRSLAEACGRSGISTQFVTVTEKLPTTGEPVSDHRAMIVTFTFP